MIFLDTCAIIDLLKKNHSLLELLNSLEDDVTIAPISIFEVSIGLYATKSKKDQDKIRTFLSKISISAEPSYELAALLYVELRKKGLEIPKNDCLIAMTVLQNPGAILVTRDVKHFRRVPLLQVRSY
jgi:predicted nucleic acid-binding protein